MTTLLSIDPGARTGVVLGEYGPTTPLDLYFPEDVSGGVTGMIEWLTYSPSARVNHVVVENFIPREGKHGVGTDASEVIGAVKMWAYTRLVPVTLQPPAGRIQAVPDSVLDKFITTSGNRDRNLKEAARHAVWFLKNRKHKPTILKGWLDE